MPKRMHDTPNAKNPAQWAPRRDRVSEAFGEDAYEAGKHLAEPTVCPECEAVYRDGRWTWDEFPPADAARHMCPACQRASDGYPAGFLTLAGDFARTHTEDLMNVARAQETIEVAEHPLHRIIGTETTEEGIVITTTDVHLPRRIGAALQRAYHGHLDIHYAAEDNLVRVRWSR